MPTYSHSKLTTFDQCKLKYKYKYVDKLPLPAEQTIEGFMGDLVHRTLEKLYKDLQLTITPTKEQLLDYYHTLWNEEWTPSIFLTKNKPAEHYKAIGEQCIIHYYDNYHPFTQERTLGLETQNLLDLGDDNYYHIRIDRFTTSQEGIYEVRDYKTSSTLPGQSTLDQDRQLAMYSLWVKQAYPDAKHVRLIWHYVAHNKELESQRTDEELLQLKGETIGKIKTLQSTTDYPPNPGTLCHWCPYQSFCPAWNSTSVGEQQTKLVDHYATLYETMEILDKELSILKEKLIPHIPLGDEQLTLYEESTPSSLKGPLKKLKSFIQEEHLWEHFATLNIKELEHLLTLPTLPTLLQQEITLLLEKLHTFKTLTIRAKISL